MVDFHVNNDQFLRLAIFTSSPRALVYKSPHAFGNPRHSLDPKLKQLVNIVSPAFQQNQRLRPQEHLMIDQVN